MMSKLQVSEIAMVSGAACVCTQSANIITTARAIEMQDICQSYCCDVDRPAAKWELFNKPGIVWEKADQGLCARPKKSIFISVLPIRDLIGMLTVASLMLNFGSYL